MQPSLEDNYEEPPCYEMTIKVVVTGKDWDDAYEYCREILYKAKKEGNREIFNVDYEDHKEC